MRRDVRATIRVRTPLEQMTRARQSIAVSLVLLTLAVCALATTAGRATSRASEPTAVAATAVSMPAFSFAVGGARLAGTELGFCGGKRANSPARSLCKKLKRGVSPESGQSPIVFVESVRLRLTTLQMAEAVPDVTFLPGDTPPDLSPRAPPAL